MFATLAGGFALDGPRRATMPRSAPAFVTAALVAAPLGHNLGLALFGGVAVGFGRRRGARRGKSAFDLARLAPLALAAAVGAACGVCVVERPPAPALGRMLAGLGPHLTLGTISEDEGLGFPLVRRLRARPGSCVANSLFVNDDVGRLIAQHPGDAALKARAAPYASRAPGSAGGHRARASRRAAGRPDRHGAARRNLGRSARTGGDGRLSPRRHRA